MFNTIEEALEDIKEGKMVIVVDDEDRENEGDLIMAAEHVTPEQINFMAIHGRGLICMPITPEKANELNLCLMVDPRDNDESEKTKFTISIDAKEGTTTGISALDRCLTIRQVVNKNSSSRDFRRPGHIFPLIADKAGTLKRIGHTEAAIDLARLAGLVPTGVICEILNEDGTMARREDLVYFKKKHHLKMITIADLIKYRHQKESLIHLETKINFPTEFGLFSLCAYSSSVNNSIYLALVKGEVKGAEKVLVRVHSQCTTGDTLFSMRCDCGLQLRTAMQMVEEEGSGVILYIDQEGRGIGLLNKLKAYKFQEEGLDTVEANLKLGFKADLRDYGLGAQVLRDLGLSTIRLLTNNPRKIAGLEGFGLKVVERVALDTGKNKYNQAYLATKKKKLVLLH